MCFYFDLQTSFLLMLCQQVLCNAQKKLNFYQVIYINMGPHSMCWQEGMFRSQTHIRDPREGDPHLRRTYYVSGMVLGVL